MPTDQLYTNRPVCLLSTNWHMTNWSTIYKYGLIQLTSVYIVDEMVVDKGPLQWRSASTKIIFNEGLLQWRSASPKVRFDEGPLLRRSASMKVRFDEGSPHRLNCYASSSILTTKQQYLKKRFIFLSIWSKFPRNLIPIMHFWTRLKVIEDRYYKTFLCG